MTSLHRPLSNALAALGLAWCSALPAAAAAVDFHGTLMAVNPLPGSTPTCAALVINKNEPPLYQAQGTSNLGSFVNNLSHCLVPHEDGVFSFDFGGGDSLYGSYDSIGDLSQTPSPFSGSYLVTGGTGSYLGWTGTVSSNGFVERDLVEGVARMTAVFDGTLVPAAVPEPAGSALVLAGLGAVAGVARRRRRRPAAGQPLHGA
ncbi:MAG: PEP-CTERM sorting domain-containing protein [Rubrivivax sp.]